MHKPYTLVQLFCMCNHQISDLKTGLGNPHDIYAAFPGKLSFSLHSAALTFNFLTQSWSQAVPRTLETHSLPGTVTGWRDDKCGQGEVVWFHLLNFCLSGVPKRQPVRKAQHRLLGRPLIKLALAFPAATLNARAAGRRKSEERRPTGLLGRARSPPWTRS